MKTISTIIIVTCLIFMTQACGTIIQGTTQQVGISSSPSNATVTINGQSKGNTPMLVDLKRKDSHMVRIELDGFEPYETTLTRQVSGWVWGNIVFGGLIGLVVDASSGGMYKLTPDQIEAEMRNKVAHYTESDEGMYISIVLKADPAWEQIGSMTVSE
ncbi:MAG: PEGA domain-containing protein [Cyclonatronaceae bacterium]